MDFKIHITHLKSGHRREVAILIPNAVNFQLISEVKDKERRFVLVNGKLVNVEITLFNVYAPPREQKNVLQETI